MAQAFKNPKIQTLDTIISDRYAAKSFSYMQKGDVKQILEADWRKMDARKITPTKPRSEVVKLNDTKELVNNPKASLGAY